MFKTRKAYATMLIISVLLSTQVNAAINLMGNYQSHTTSGRSIIFTGTGGGKLRVTPYTDTMIRIQAAKSGESFLPDDHYEMVANHDLGGTLSITDAGNYFSITTAAADGMEVRLQKTGMNPAFYKKKDGGLLLEADQGVSWDSKLNQIKQQFVVQRDEHFTGLGHGDRGRATTLDLKGTALTREYGSQSVDPSQSMLVVPYYLSSRGYGLFLNSTFHNYFSFGKDGDYSVRIDDFGYGGQMDYFVILGPSFPNIIDRYTQLTGRPRLPQKAIFGLMLSDKGYKNNEGAIWWQMKVTELRNAGFPLDCAIFDNRWRAGGGAWQDSWFEFDSERYPDPAAFETWCNDQGLIVSLDLNRNNVDQCAGWDRDYAIPNTGTDYIDYSRQDVRDWAWNMMWSEAFNPALGYPGDMIWIDEPDDVHVDPDKPTGDGRHWAENMNYYFFLNAKAFGQQGWDPDTAGHIGEAKRPFIFIRGGTAGGQRYATHWTGDIHATYEEMKLQTRGMLLSGLSGFPYFNHDAGGYYDNGPTDPMYRQWSMGMASFSPIWRPHGPGLKKSRWPTDRNALCQEAAHRYSELRYKLMPYIYKYAHEASETGLPMARPMLLDYPDNPEAWKRDLQYLFGNEILVAPVYSDGPIDTEVWFPPYKGNWYDFWKVTKYASGEQARTFRYETGTLPLFVKEGSIIPMALYAQSTAWIDDTVRELHVYTGRDGSFTLYDDDGVTEKYNTRCENMRTVVQYTDRLAKLNIAAAVGSYNGAPSARSYRIYFHGLKNGEGMMVNGIVVPQFSSEAQVETNGNGAFWDEDDNTLIVYTGSQSVTEDVEIKPSGLTPVSIDPVSAPEPPQIVQATLDAAILFPGVDVSIQNSPMKITLSGEGKTLVEVTEIVIGKHTYKTIQSVQQNGDTYNVTFPDSNVLTISPVKNGVRVYFDPSYGSNDVIVKMNHLGGHFFGIRERNINGINPDVTGLTMSVGMASGGGGEAWAGTFSTFYMNSRGYGSFFDTFYNGSYKLGISGDIELMHQDCGVIDWYIFYGPTGDKIHEGLFSVIGEPQKIPMWACGPTVWRNDNTGSAEILNDVDQYISLKIPVTHGWVDRPYSDGYNAWSKMNFKATFADPSLWISKLNNKGVEFSTWITPAMFGIEAECPLQLAGDFGYVDLSQQGAYDWYKNNLKTLQYAHGVKGHKIDRVDEKFPVDAAWSDGTASEARWNTYVYLNTKATGEALAESHPNDHFLFARVAYNRSQQYLDAIWGGDVGATLKDMGENMCNAMRCSYMGFPVWGSDGGGYFSDDISDDQYIRWTQFCLYSGMFEFMIDNRLPWNKSPSLQTALQKIHMRRMELLPYIYSLANTSDRTGVLMQPMAYRYPGDSATYPMWDQYFFGAAFLVAPIYEDNSTNRSVYLPEGTWIDQNDYAVTYSGNQTISYNAPQSVTPTFIKKNTIYPDGMVYAGNIKSWDSDFDNHRYLNINAFPGGTETSSSFTYVDFLDNDAEKQISMATDSAGSVTLAFPSMPTEGAIRVRLEDAPSSVIVNGTTISNPDFDDKTKLLTVNYENGQDVQVVINMNQGLSSAFLECAGQVVMEGENFQALDVRDDPGNASWAAGASTAGYVGAGYVETTGLQGVNGVWANAAEVSYTVKFSTTGSYDVWIRRYAETLDNHSVFVGLHDVNTGVSNTTGSNPGWAWKNIGTLNVAEPGLQIIQLRRKQAGYKIDRILLTTNSGIPSGDGPNESPIHVNSLPEISSTPSLYIDAGMPFSYLFSATDQDDDLIHLSAEALPSWLSFADGVLSGTADADDIGLHPVTLRASDGIGNSDQSFTIRVSAPGNDSPVINSTPVTRVIENQSYRYAIFATDADGDSLTLDMPGKPDWLSLSENIVSGTPLTGTSGIFPVILTVSDGDVTATQRFNVAVFEMPTPDNVLMNASFEDGTTSWTVGDAVIVGTEAQDRNSSLQVTEASAPSIKQTAALEIGKIYTISVWIHAAGMTDGVVVFDTSDAYDESGQGQFVISGANSGWTLYTGSFTANTPSITIRMFTNRDFAGTIYFDNIVLAETGIINAAPVITSIPKTSTMVNMPYTYILLAADAENDSLTFKKGNMPAWLRIDATTGMISGTPVDTGSYDIVFEVSDGKSFAVQNFTIAVTGNSL